jgi:hypothetical protein
VIHTPEVWPGSTSFFLLFEKPCVGLPKGLEKQEREATDVYSMAAVLLVEPSDPWQRSRGLSERN